MSRHIRELRDRALAVRLALAGRVHQYPEIQALRRFLGAFAVDCVFDVGANRGQYATMLRSDAGFGGTILSFEPNPDIFSELERNASSDRRWHVFNMALSDFDGMASFNIMAADQFSSLKAPSGEQDAIFAERNRVTRTVDMQCRRLESLLPDLRRAHGFTRPFLKMDTQGHDLSVCEGAGDALRDMAGVQTELGVRPIYEGGTGYRAMIDWLAEHGFVPSAFFANNKGHFPLLVEMDGIFVNRALLPREG
ncbi:FkbM family methyltransferase [Sphingobium indicum]|uniref:FkbM family methyltransferase n=2 Tax=Sphingobium indicum TaxID=332055 RepID=A0A1L5BNC4_SPHIB|nr:FkbM family methyltransferase [Sphingobium indicum]APL94277.1 FkbM family methyltransferase [Sphingobium indicum B90A]KEY97772.1 FkbM family methyltransferase [Sphingomonas sp. BHC-A]NYI21169.1 FkbM family methyltransferase [Sphingobium indicum]RYM04019.1 FkbM family methyltransferase [Sphingobium indicum]